MRAEHFNRPFRVDRQVYGYAIVVSVAGEVDALTVRELRHEMSIALALATRHAPVVVDLSDVVFFSAAGLNELHREHLAAKAAGVSFRVVARHRHVLRPFEVTGLDHELRPCPTLAEALRSRAPDRARSFAVPM